MIKKLLSIALIVAACQISNAQSFSLYYPFTNCANSFPGPATGSVDPTPAPMATGVVSGSFMAVNQGTYTSNGTGYFGWGGFSVGYASVTPTDTYTNMTGAISTKYYQISISPASGYNITVSDMLFQVSRSSAGPRNWVVRTSGDGYTANCAASYTALGAAITSSNAPIVSILTGTATNTFFWTKHAVFSSTNTPEGYLSNNICKVIFAGAGVTNQTSPIGIRFFPWNSVGAGTNTTGISGGTFRIDSVIINGTATLSTGLNKVSHDLNAKLKLYPNPSNDGDVIIETSAKNYSKIEVINITGAIVASQNVSFAEDKIQLNLATLPTGTYFVKITTPTGVITEKLVISK